MSRVDPAVSPRASRSAFGTTTLPAESIEVFTGRRLPSACHPGKAGYMLAMKLLAMRFGEDDDDIQVLLRQTGIVTVDEALDLLARKHPQQEPPAKTRLF